MAAASMSRAVAAALAVILVVSVAFGADRFDTLRAGWTRRHSRGCVGPTRSDEASLGSSYTAEQIARTYELARQHEVNLLGSVTWAFEFEGQPYFDGFRDLATNGIDKPVLNVFRMLGRMGGDFVQVERARCRSRRCGTQASAGSPTSMRSPRASVVRGQVAVVLFERVTLRP